MHIKHNIRCKIKLENFEGPLDLLLYLIQKEEIEIYDIPIAYVTKQYISYLDLMQELNLEIAGEYLYMASLLLNIKSRMLLPKKTRQDGTIEDPREELTSVLIEYKQFKNAGEYLRMKYKEERNHISIGKVHSPKSSAMIMTVPLDFFDLMKTAWNVLKRENRIVKLPEKDKINIQERIEFIKQKVYEKARLKFIELFEREKVSGLYFIGTFFALLELMRQRYLSVRQRKPFGNIWIYKRIQIKENEVASSELVLPEQN